MFKQGFISFIIFIIVIAIVIAVAIPFFSKTPSSKVKQLAESINKYPNALTWDILTDPKICPDFFDLCQSPPVNINFTTQDSWTSIYSFYIENMKKEGWSTNSYILTQIPSTVVFNVNLSEKETCQASLAKGSPGLSSKKYAGSKNDIYSFDINCLRS